jgi:hypothetical protein
MSWVEGPLRAFFTLASKSDFTMPQIVFYTEIDDHGVRQGDMGWIITRWWHPVAYKVALDMLCRAMRSSPHRRIVMDAKMAHDGGTFVRCCRLFCLINRSKIT